MATAARKPAAKAPARRTAAAKPAPVPAPAPVKAAKPAKAVKAKVDKAPKTEKPKKPKLVRDSFTIPKAEYAVLEELKARAAKSGRPAKKSEVLRAGLKALAALSDSALAAALAQVPAIKTGRPART